jgi:hypothetical protein
MQTLLHFSKSDRNEVWGEGWVWVLYSCQTHLHPQDSECLPSISGRYCKQVATISILIHQYVTESFAYISIIAVSIVAQEERDLMWRKQNLHEKKTIVKQESLKRHFVYGV